MSQTKQATLLTTFSLLRYEEKLVPYHLEQILNILNGDIIRHLVVLATESLLRDVQNKYQPPFRLIFVCMCALPSHLF